MRDYGIVSPKFWTGKTGRALRGHREAQILALYLMTSPHSTMTGVFYCPMVSMEYETGLDKKGASKGLARLIDEAFCEFDAESETVFVLNMAHWQIGSSLKPDDKRVIGLRKEVSRMAPAALQRRFLEVYGERYHLQSSPAGGGKSQGASETHRSQEQEQEQEKSKEKAESSLRSDSLRGAPTDLEERKAERLRRITTDAITSFNAILAKPVGVLPQVRDRVGFDTRVKNVGRCVNTARDICQEEFKSPTITREFWDAYFAECSRDDFRSGRQSGGKGHENWKPSFEYLTRADVMLSVFDKATSEAA